MSEKVVMVGERRFRLPFLDLIPFDDEQDAALGSAIREAGKVKVPVLCWKQKKTSTEDTVVDGAHRVLWAAELKLDRVPIRYESYDSEDEAKADCEEINLERRHLSQQQLESERRRRIERVAELRRQGESLRAIADAEGVSESQVRTDLKAATAQGCAVDPPDGQVTGRDNKKRSVNPVFCKRCKRLGQPVKGCQQCERARKDAGKKKAAKAKQKAEQAEKVDCFKNPVPAKRQDALFDPWIQKAIDFLAETSESFRSERLMDQMHKKAKFYPFFHERDFVDGCGFVIDYLDRLIGHLKDKRPEAVCCDCNGEGCGTCKMSGLLPRSVYQEAKK